MGYKGDICSGIVLCQLQRVSLQNNLCSSTWNTPPHTPSLAFVFPLLFLSLFFFSLFLNHPPLPVQRLRLVAASSGKHEQTELSNFLGRAATSLWEKEDEHNAGQEK